MKCTVTAIALFLLVFTADAESEYRSDRILVKPKRDVPGQRIAAQHAVLRANVHRQYQRFGGWQVITLPRGLSVQKALLRYRRSGLFERVQPDYIHHILATPDDFYFTNGALYGMQNISAPAAWDVQTNAENVIIGIVDTGIRYTHEDLASNMWVNPCMNCPVDGIVYTNDLHGINAITGSGNPNDDQGHGTHVAGTTGASGNNGVGVVGVCWKVQLMALKFLDSSGSGFESDAIECINYAIAHGAHVLNNSWGGGPASSALSDAIEACRTNGIIFVAAAGNSGVDTDLEPHFPSDFEHDNLVSVGAVSSSDANVYNFGKDSVDLGAPGISIQSTYNASDSGYAVLSGTSMATPHVAGALALVKAHYPSESYTQLIHRVLGNVDQLPGLAALYVTGGRLNVAAALTNAPRPVANFTANLSVSIPPLTISFTNTTLGAATNMIWDFGDGYSATNVDTPTHTYSTPANYTVTMSVTATNGTSLRRRVLPVSYPYLQQSAGFAWIATNGLTPIVLTDDSVSGVISLPFNFMSFASVTNKLLLTSNGLLGFNNTTALSSAENTDLPDRSPPNNILAPYWTDLNPGVAGKILHGVTGAAPHRVFVASWVGVPHFLDNAATFTFQALLFEGSNQIIFQYAEVQSTNLTLGAGRLASVGIEDSTGRLGARHSYNGSALLTNQQAILFTSAGKTITSPPVLTGINPPSPSTNQTPILTGVSEPASLVSIYTNSNCSGNILTQTVANAAGAFSVPVMVALNSTNTFHASAIDVLGNPSPCSAAGIAYIHLDPASDADGDGLPNGWELLFGLDPLSAAGNDGAAGDPDGDGFANLDEFTAGTSPTDSALFPAISIAVAGQDVVVTIQSVPGKTYRLQRCNDLANWTNHGPPQSGDGSVLTFTDNNAATQSPSFYRVKISP